MNRRRPTTPVRFVPDGGRQYEKRPSLPVTHDPDKNTWEPAHKRKPPVRRAPERRDSLSRVLDLSEETCSARPLPQEHEEKQEAVQAETQEEEVAPAGGGAEKGAGGAALVGAKVKVLWADNCRWYKGVVDRYDAARGYHISYADSDQKWHKLDQPGEMWRLLAPAPAPAHGGVADRSQVDAGVRLLGSAAPASPVPRAPAAPPVAPVPPCWGKGSKLEALDGPGTWYEASVLDERGHGDARELLVHYKGWKARFNEWLGVGSGRVRAAGSGELGPCKRLAAAATAANLKTGSRVDALDPHGTWYPAAVLDERGAGLSRELLVHYNGWNKRLDEWMGVCSGRLRAASGKLGPSKPTVASAPGAAAGSDGATPAAARVPKMQAEDGGGNKPRKTNIAEDDLVWAKVWGTRDGWCGRTLSPNMGVRTALTSPCCLQVACAGDRNQQG